jgi:hypothetical protein
MAPSGAASRNGMRQPQLRSCASVSHVESASATAAPPSVPSAAVIETTLPHSARRFFGAYSTRNADVPVHSPPAEKPCAQRSRMSRTGARKPTLA